MHILLICTQDQEYKIKNLTYVAKMYVNMIRWRRLSIIVFLTHNTVLIKVCFLPLFYTILLERKLLVKFVLSFSQIRIFIFNNELSKISNKFPWVVMIYILLRLIHFLNAVKNNFLKTFPLRYRRIIPTIYSCHRWNFRKSSDWFININYMFRRYHWTR